MSLGDGLIRLHVDSFEAPDFDLDLLVALCRWCHDQTDAPYARGRLLVSSLGDGQFHFDVIRRHSEGEWPS